MRAARLHEYTDERSEGEQVIYHPVQTCGTCRPCRQGETMYCENQSFNGLTTDGEFPDELLPTARGSRCPTVSTSPRSRRTTPSRRRSTT